MSISSHVMPNTYSEVVKYDLEKGYTVWDICFGVKSNMGDCCSFQEQNCHRLQMDIQNKL